MLGGPGEAWAGGAPKEIVAPTSGVAIAALADLCLRCSAKPCLQACPVEAFTPAGYAVDACAAHLHGPSGGDCMQGGCLARRACPVGVPYRYAPEHAAFHMRAFARSHRPDGS